MRGGNNGAPDTRAVVDAGLRKAPLRRRLSRMLAAVLMGLALLPAAAGAAAPVTPTWVSVVSGDGTMDLKWNNSTRATGYQYRYTNSKIGFFSCNDSCFLSGWLTASSSGTDTDFTTAKGLLTVGTT